MRRMYSENQIVNVLENKNIKAKTFLQDEYNWKSEQVELKTLWLNGLTKGNSFIRCVQINRRVDLIVSCAVSNQTESSIYTKTQEFLFNNDITLPEEISKLIYRKDGTTCNNPKQSIDGILSSQVLMTNNTGGNVSTINGVLVSNNPNKLNIWIPSGNTVAIGAGQNWFIDFRVSILL